MKTFRSSEEQAVSEALERIFLGSSDSIEHRIESFPKYVRRQHLTRFLTLYEIFKRVMNIKGSIVECGVWRGFGLMSWAKFSAILEPNNLTRRIFGFDTFDGFPDVAIEDHNRVETARVGDFGVDSYAELIDLIDLFDRDRFLGHLDKVHLVKGDARREIPRFLKENPHLIVSILFLDFDLYEPTKVALESFVPRMPRGAVIAFDELDNPMWPGEGCALLETLGVGSLRLERMEFDPYISFATIGS